MIRACICAGDKGAHNLNGARKRWLTTGRRPRRFDYVDMKFIDAESPDVILVWKEISLTKEGRSLVAAVILCIAQAAASPVSAQEDAWQLDPATTSEKKLVGRAAISAIVGNTVVILSAGDKRETSAQYYMANGKMRRARNEQPNFDNWDLEPEEKWSVREEADQLCISGGGWKEDLCLGIAVTGDRVTLKDNRIGLIHGMILKGDARNLSSAAGKANKAKARALVGNTLFLKAADRQADTDSVIYFLSDGVGRAKRGHAAAVPIKWMLQLNGNLCIVEVEREFRDNSCTSLSIDGSAATLAAPDRAEIRGQILKGNALKI